MNKKFPTPADRIRLNTMHLTCRIDCTGGVSPEELGQIADKLKEKNPEFDTVNIFNDNNLGEEKVDVINRISGQFKTVLFSDVVFKGNALETLTFPEKTTKLATRDCQNNKAPLKNAYRNPEDKSVIRLLEVQKQNGHSVASIAATFREKDF